MVTEAWNPHSASIMQRAKSWEVQSCAWHDYVKVGLCTSGKGKEWEGTRQRQLTTEDTRILSSDKCSNYNVTRKYKTPEMGLNRPRSDLGQLREERSRSTRD